MRSPEVRWTHPSVVALAASRDPVAEITMRAREIAVKAMDAGWSGPPFDPLALAAILQIEVVPRDDVRDARTVPAGQGARIEFNPSRPRGRLRYSIAHEIAHTLFPDCTEQIRNRSLHSEMAGDDWQLEALCNLAAAELLMPIGSLSHFEVAADNVDIDALLKLRKEFDVSTEALFIRFIHLINYPRFVFCATRIEQQGSASFGRYRVDYIIPSRGYKLGQIPRGMIPSDTLLTECTAIGYTAKGIEHWGESELHVEVVGIPPYPGNVYPRLLGIASPIKDITKTASGIKYLIGDATQPRGEGKKIVVQIVNDKASSWGGRGFAAAVRERWPEAHNDFTRWLGTVPLRLGAVHVVEVAPDLILCSMIAQHGYGPSVTPRIRYSALRECLQKVCDVSTSLNASIHMPRLGTGEARGSWDIVEELINESLLDRGVSVTVYDLPGTDSNRYYGRQISFKMDKSGKT